METRILRTKQVKDLVKQLAANDFYVNEDEGNYIVTDGTNEVFRALKHSNGSSYLVRYNKGLIAAA